MDLVKGSVPKRQLKRFLDPDASLMEDNNNNHNPNPDEDLPGGADPANAEFVMGGGSFKKLNRAVARLIDDFSMVSFLQLDVQDEDSVAGVLSHIDDAIQYHEAQEPREPNDEVDYGDDGMMME